MLGVRQKTASIAEAIEFGSVAIYQEKGLCPHSELRISKSSFAIATREKPAEPKRSQSGASRLKVLAGENPIESKKWMSFQSFHAARV